MTRTFFTYFLLFLLYFTQYSQAQESKSSDIQGSDYYVLIDVSNQEILTSKNKDARADPSSMTKLMTAYVIFDMLKTSKIKLFDQCIIGRNAWGKRGSTMFLGFRDLVSIDELLRGLLAVSGNDAAIALAESTMGDVDNFVALMNQKAKGLGMNNSHFTNPHGLNEEGHYMSVYDIAKLLTAIYQNFPKYIHYLGIKNYTYKNIYQRNRNPLIYENYEGIVGGKTGHTTKGGYGVANIVKRDNITLVGVVNKSKTPKDRVTAIKSLFDYGFNNYSKLSIFTKGQTIKKIDIWSGKEGYVEAILKENIILTIPNTKLKSKITAKIEYEKPIFAPIKKDMKIATLYIEIKGYKKIKYDLFAKNEVESANYLTKLKQILKYFYNKTVKL